MPNYERRNNELHQDSEVEAVRGNLIELLRLLAKEVARRLACKADSGESRARLPPKQSHRSHRDR